MTQLYVLSQDGTSAINLSQFEYVYIGEDNRIKAVNGQKMIRLGDYASRDGAKAALGSMLYYASRNPGVVRVGVQLCNRNHCDIGIHSGILLCLLDGIS